MIEEQSLPAVETPSKGAIVKATVIALAVALVILFTAVLPAEYGIDPLKTGKAAGSHRHFAGPGDGHSRPRDPCSGRNLHSATQNLQSGLRGFGPASRRRSRSNITCKRARAWFTPGRRPARFNSNSTASPTQNPNPTISRATSWTTSRSDLLRLLHRADHRNSWLVLRKQRQRGCQIHLTTAGFYDSAKMFSGDDKENMPVEDAK